MKLAPWDDLVGRPYAEGDCWATSREILARNGEALPERPPDGELPGWGTVDGALEPLDLVVLQDGSGGRGVGVVVEDGYVVSSFPREGVAARRWSLLERSGQVVGVYRRGSPSACLLSGEEHGGGKFFKGIGALYSNPLALAQVVVGVGISLIPGGAVVGVPLIVMGGSQAWAQAFSVWFAPGPLSKATTDKDLEGSPTFNAEGFSNVVQNGQPIPAVYGKHRFGGQIIQQFFRVNEQGDSILYTLLALGHGPIQSIGGLTADTDKIQGDVIPETLEINGQPASNYEDVVFSCRMGTANQDPIPGFNETVTTQAVGVELAAGAAATVATTSTPISAFEVNVSHPSGLYKISGSGATQQYSVTYRVSWREAGADSDYAFQDKTVAAANKAEFATSVRIEAPFGEDSSGAAVEKFTEVRVQRITAADTNSQVSTISWTSLNEIRDVGSGIAHIGLALAGWEVNGKHVQGQIPTFTHLLEGRKVWVWDGASTTAPVMVQQYNDGHTTKEDLDASTDQWNELALTGSSVRIGFQFTQAGQRELRQVRVRARKNPSATASVAGNVYAELYADLNGKPTGSALATSQNYDAKTVPTSGKDVFLSFTTPYLCSHGVVYHVVLRATYTASGVNCLQFASLVTNLAGDLETYDGVTWSDHATRVCASLWYKGRKPGENPAWIVADLLINDQFGLGPWVRLNDLSLADFQTWASYCDDAYDANVPLAMNRPRWGEIGLPLDSASPAWELLLKIAALGRAGLVKIGRRIVPIIDKPVSATALFNDANTVFGSLQESFLGIDERPNHFVGQFLNRETNYGTDFADVPSTTTLADGEDFRTATANVFGFTAMDQARRYLTFELNKAKTLKKTISFKVPPDGMTVFPGDVFKFAHRLNRGETLYTGRMDADAADATHFQPDQSISVGDVTYETWIEVRTTGTGAVVLQAKKVEDPIPGVSNYTYPRSVPMLGSWNGGDLPKKGDPFVMRLSSFTLRLYRCLSSVLESDLSTTISAIEYQASVYNDDPGEPEEFTSALPFPQQIPDAVTGLVAKEVHVRKPDGSLVSSIEVSFAKPRGDVWADVFVKDPAYPKWRFMASAKEPPVRLDCLADVGGQYQIAVAARSAKGAVQSLAKAPTTSIQIVGPWVLPPDVTGFTATVVGDFVLLEWTAATASTATLTGGHAAGQGRVVGYEIRKGSTWTSGEVVARQHASTTILVPGISEGASTFWIRALDGAGNKSGTPTSVTVTAAERYDEETVSRDEVALGFPGTKTLCALTGAPTPLLAMTGTPAVYEFPRQTVTRRTYRVFVDVGWLPYDPMELVSEQTYVLGSAYAQRRYVSGWSRNAIDPGPAILGTSADTGTFKLGSFWAKHRKVSGVYDIEAETTAVVEERHSTDGASFTGWAPLKNGEAIDFSDIDVRLSMTGTSLPLAGGPTQRLMVESCRLLIARSRVIQAGNATSSTGGEVAVTYSKAFASAPDGPALGGRLLTAGDSASYSAATATGFNLSVYNNAGARIAKVVQWISTL